MVIVFAGYLDEEYVLEGLQVAAYMWVKWTVGWKGKLDGVRQCGGFA
jgi:hypothetical protein